MRVNWTVREEKLPTAPTTPITVVDVNRVDAEGII
jgi:hypothetical protein